MKGGEKETDFYLELGKYTYLLRISVIFLIHLMKRMGSLKIKNIGPTLKSSQNKKDLNYVTAAQFSVSSSQLPAAKKHQKPGSCEVIKVLLIL